MSKYTTTVKSICESFAKANGYTGTDVNEIIQNAYQSIFSFYFPIFEPTHRAELCKKILKHYYFREIGAETYGAWKVQLDTRLNEIMPFYNQLYKSETMEFDPFNEVDFEKIDERERNETEKRTDRGYIDNSAEAGSMQMYSDTPQGGLEGVESGEYLTNATKNNQTSGSVTASNNDTDGTRDEKEKVISTEKGKRSGASYSELLQKYRETFLNIDKMIIDCLQDLFFMLY